MTCSIFAAICLWTSDGLVVQGQDSVEFLNGTKLTGKILEIRKAAKEFDFQTKIAGQAVSKTYSYATVHAVQFNGKRFVLNAMPATDDKDSRDISKSGVRQRSKDEVKRLIQSKGASDPDWLATTPLNHPASLDLSWPLKVKGPWNESKNVGQYMWGRVNPNPSRWRSGIRLMYECIQLHQGDPDLLQRDYSALADKYFVLFQDYTRAAYWFEKSNAATNTKNGIHLAECYYRLGNKQMAMDFMRGKTLHIDSIKLLGEMGEIEQALNVTKVYGKTNMFNEAFLNAGDALRSAGRLDEAINYYQMILDRNKARNPQYSETLQGPGRRFHQFDQAV